MMKPSLLFLLALLVLWPLSAQAGVAMTGSFDLQFTLSEARVDGTCIGTPVAQTGGKRAEVSESHDRRREDWQGQAGHPSIVAHSLPGFFRFIDDWMRASER
jgi:hypothetical protein